MKIRLHLRPKEYFWNTLKTITNTFSNLTVNNLGNGNIKCSWEIGSIDNLRIELSKTSFYAIRLFDISTKRNLNMSTCIMKEIQVSKFQSSISFPVPINKGVYYFEFGYRKKNGEWRKISHKVLNLGYRIKKILHNFDHNDWFISKRRIANSSFSLHEETYQLSLHAPNGGSEKIIHDPKDI